MKCIPFSNQFGARIINCTVQEILSNPSYQTQLRENLCFYKILHLPNQMLTPDEEQQLANLFPHQNQSGPYRTSFQQWKLPDYPHIQVQGWGTITNHYGLSGTMQPKVNSLEWHTDGIHETDYPPYMTQIYCIETPLKGGQTLFLDTTSLWDQLSKDDQDCYRNKTVVYQPIRNKMSKNGCLSLSGKANVYHSPEDDIENNLPVTTIRQPLFRQIPEMNRISMSVAPMYLSHMEGYSFEDSSKRIESLIQQIIHTQYIHTYQKGDVLLFDNRQCLHSAMPNQDIDCSQSIRLLHRIRMDSSRKIIPLFPSFQNISNKKI